MGIVINEAYVHISQPEGTPKIGVRLGMAQSFEAEGGCLLHLECAGADDVVQVLDMIV